MLKNISPALKGLITGALMIAATLFLYYGKVESGSFWQNLPIILYAAGIIWTLMAYWYSPAFTPKFSALFGQGFRCFLIVTLVMVVFSGFFIKSHPEFAEQNAVAYREHLVKEENMTPVQIDEEITKYKKQFTTTYVSRSIFGYLVIGAVVTAALSGFLLIRRSNQ